MGSPRVITDYLGPVSTFRVRAICRALTTSLLVPLATLFLYGLKDLEPPTPEHLCLRGILHLIATIPVTLNLVTVITGMPWCEFERGWYGLPGWQRAISSVVALLCGLTTGAAVVLLVLLLGAMDPKA